MAESAPQTPRRRLPPEERRAQIFSAALRCFAARGYHATTMDDLAATSGLSKGSLYWHFDSKLEVFLGLFDALAAELFASFDAVEATESRAADKLLAELQVGLALLEAERAFVMVWAEFLALPEGRARMAAHYAETRRRLAGIIAEGVARGELRAVDPNASAATLLAIGEGLGLQIMVDPGAIPSALVEDAWKIIAGGLIT